MYDKPTYEELEQRVKELEQEAQGRKEVEEALTKSEERYALAMKAANDGMWDRNLKTGRIYFSPQWKAMLGYRNDELPNRYVEWKSRIHPDDYEMVMEQLRSYFDDNSPYYMSEYRLKHKDGSYRWVRARGATIRDHSGKPTHFAGSQTDITEQKKMEEELLNSQKLESIGILAGGIAHDFNNILTAIANNIYVAKDYLNDRKEAFDILTSAEEAAMRARHLTGQLLTFSKGGVPLLKTVSVADLLKESARFALRGSNVKSRCSIPYDLWNVEVDEGQINQVINNLVINARQAMPEGGTVSVRAENAYVGPENALPLEDGNYVRITVKDKGCGIQTESISNVFDPYFSTKKKGNGLGLATSYSIIKQHRGHITVESTVGEGTRFQIYLPASMKKVVPQEYKVEEAPAGCGKVLVLEDEETIIEIVEIILSRSGYEVEFARDGREAIRLYKKAMKACRPFSLVMMDLTIPGGMGGEEAIKRLKKIDPDVKAVVCSGYSNAPIMADFRSYGFCDVLLKPYDVKELRKKLSNIVGGGMSPMPDKGSLPQSYGNQGINLRARRNVSCIT